MFFLRGAHACPLTAFFRYRQWMNGCTDGLENPNTVLFDRKIVVLCSCIVLVFIFSRLLPSCSLIPISPHLIPCIRTVHVFSFSD
jgi:hypothetical protein